MKSIQTILIAAVVLAACTPAEDKTNDMPPGLDLTKMDLTVSPKEDFYRFANGKWLDETEIPADQGRWGGFGELRKRNNKKVLAIMEDAAENPAFEAGSDERKAVEFFSVGMDSLLAEKAGANSLKKWFDQIDDIGDRANIQQVLADMHKNGYGAFHWESAFANMKNSQVNSLYIGAGGLGLPNRDYYTKDDQKSKEIREKYVEHVARMFTLAGVDGDVTQFADRIMNLETRLAEASLTPIERRNRLALYNPHTVEQLQEMVPAISWEEYLKTVNADLGKIDSVIVRQPKFMAEMNNILSTLPIEDIQAY